LLRKDRLRDKERDQKKQACKHCKNRLSGWQVGRLSVRPSEHDHRQPADLQPALPVRQLDPAGTKSSTL
jgi:hypothetical protein